MTIGEDFERLLALAQAGDEATLTAFYRDVNPGLVRFLAAQARDVAEDLAQETWVAVARGLSTFRGGERDFRAWIFTIARRRLIQHWRDLGRRPSTPLAPHDLAAMVATTEGPDALVIGREAAAELVAGLPPEQAEIILLRVVAGFEAAEVAAIVGRTAVSVRVMQHRALKRISLRLGAHQPATRTSQ